MSASPATILLVEDDQDDAFFLQRALEQARPDIPLHITSDGEQALDYLNGQGDYSDRATHPLPTVILLDLKLPYFNGFQILERLRESPSQATITVFVLTSSPEERDRQRALDLGAKAYLIKPPTPEMLLEILGPAPYTAPQQEPSPAGQ